MSRLTTAQVIAQGHYLDPDFNPASLTVSAVCENGVTFPVGPTNGVIPGTDTSVVWDVYSFVQANPQSPLPQSTYTLEIFDERGMGAARSPGLLSPNSNLRFALYSPVPYTPLASGKPCPVPFFARRIVEG